MRSTKARRIREFKKEVEKRFGIEWYQINFEQFKKLSTKALDEFFELLKTKLEDANSWGRHLASVYWSERDCEMGISFYEHGDYKRQFTKFITFTSLHSDSKNFNDFVIGGIRKGLFIDSSDLYPDED